MSNPSDTIEIDEDNYVVLITDEGGAVYNSKDQTQAVAFKADELRQIIYGKNDLNTGSGLLYPVTLFFNSNFDRFIIERPPQEISLLDSSGERISYKLPWSIFYFEFNDDFKIEKVQLFFRPLNAATKHDMLYRFPTPFSDDNGVMYDDVLSQFGPYLKVESPSNMRIYNIFESFFGVFKNSMVIENSDMNLELLPEAFSGNGLKTHFEFAKFLKDIPLEKFVLLDYRPYLIKENDNLNFYDKGTHLNFNRIIEYSNIENEPKHDSFLSLIKSVLNIT